MDLKRFGLVLLLAASPAAAATTAPSRPTSSARTSRSRPTSPRETSSGSSRARRRPAPRPRQLIDDVDGMVTIDTVDAPGAPSVGLTQQPGPRRYDITLQPRLPRRRAQARPQRRRAARVRPRRSTSRSSRPSCATSSPASCRPSAPASRPTPATAPRRRSASPTRSPSGRCAAPCPLAGAGYGVATPASLEDWGAPLARLAIADRRRAQRLTLTFLSTVVRERALLEVHRRRVAARRQALAETNAERDVLPGSSARGLDRGLPRTERPLEADGPGDRPQLCCPCS